MRDNYFINKIKQHRDKDLYNIFQLIKNSRNDFYTLELMSLWSERINKLEK